MVRDYSWKRAAVIHSQNNYFSSYTEFILNWGSKRSRHNLRLRHLGGFIGMVGIARFELMD